MTSSQINSSGKKRNFNAFMSDEMSAKLKSKEDFYIYIDKHCKSIAHYH